MPRTTLTDEQFERLHPHAGRIFGFVKQVFGPGQRTRDPLRTIDLPRTALALAQKGILTPTQLALRALRGVDLEAEASELGLPAGQVGDLYEAAVQALTPEQRLSFEQIVARPFPTGGLDPAQPDYEHWRREIEKVSIITPDQLRQLLARPANPFLPLGPLRAIDHRSCLGDARNQGMDNTCAAFGATVVAEALEYMRDRRQGPIDLSEEYCWWVAKGGQTISGSNGDPAHMLSGYVHSGGCEEWLWPYREGRIFNNWSHVPVTEEVIDRAQLFKQGALKRLAEGDIDALKAVLASGRCVAVDCSPYAFDATHGYFGPGGSGKSGHIVAIVGYIDQRPDFDPAWGGGLLIVRNSWGKQLVNGASLNYLGEEYAGHVLIPYSWYQQHTSSPFTVQDLGELSDELSGKTQWFAEYYANPSLSGAPAHTELIPSDTLSYDWQGKSPAPGIPATNFSARFSQLQRFRPGWYQFALTGDDGVRLWVDDRLVINGWKDQAPTNHLSVHYLSGGDHTLRVEYYQRGGGATVRLAIAPVRFRYELFDNPDLAGTPVATFVDTSTELEWRHVAPVGANGQFSLRATCLGIHFPLRQYRFHARHTGGCRIWLGDSLVLDDWDGHAPDGGPVRINGVANLRVEFRHTGTYPSLYAQRFYRAALAFNWSEDDWIYQLHADPEHARVAHDGQADGYPNIDSRYEGFHTQSLSGAPLARVELAQKSGVPGQYTASDGPPLTLHFRDSAQFGAALPQGVALPDRYWSALLQRRVWIKDAGRYAFYLNAVGGFRLIVDGKELIRDHECFGEDALVATADLAEGVHDIAIELAANMWGMKLDFQMDRPRWRARYYKAADRSTCIEDVRLPLEEVLIRCPPLLKGVAYTVSLIPGELVWAPLGRYRLAIRSSGALRVTYDEQTLLERPAPEVLIHESVLVEHRGGRLPLEVTYTAPPALPPGEPPVLAIDLHPAGYFGEIYRGTNLENPQRSEPYNTPPVAYVYQHGLYFNWEQSGVSARVGPSSWSARWYGQVELPVGRYSVELVADDGVRIFVDGRLIVESWQVQAPMTIARTLDLVGRIHTVRVEYFQKSGGSRLQLTFRRVPQLPLMLPQ